MSRYGRGARPTYLLLSFNAPLDPASAKTRQTIRSSDPAIAGSSQVGPLRRAARGHSDSGSEITLEHQNKISAQSERCRSVRPQKPDGIVPGSSARRPPGSNFVTRVTRMNLAGSESQLPTLGLIEGSGIPT